MWYFVASNKVWDDEKCQLPGTKDFFFFFFFFFFLAKTAKWGFTQNSFELKGLIGNLRLGGANISGGIEIRFCQTFDKLALNRENFATFPKNPHEIEKILLGRAGLDHQWVSLHYYNFTVYEWSDKIQRNVLGFIYEEEQDENTSNSISWELIFFKTKSKKKSLPIKLFRNLPL